MTDNPTKSPRCDNAQSRLRARVFLARYAHLSLSETEGMTDDDLQTACENIAGFLQAELYRQKVPAPIRIEPPVIRRVDPEGLLEALSQPIGEPDSEHAMLRGKADAADALLAALGTEETEVALQRLDTLRTAAATLKTLDGILAVFPEPDAPSNEPAIVVRARAAADFQAELDKARTDWRRWIGVTTDLTKIAAAVHMQDAKTAAEVADAAVARIEALERDVQTQAGKIRELDAETKAITTERDAWRNALLGLAGMGLEEAGAKSPADVADLAWARVGRPARQRAESLKTDRDNFLAVLRCVGESLCVDLDGCRVSEFEPRLCNAIRSTG